MHLLVFGVEVMTHPSNLLFFLIIIEADRALGNLTDFILLLLLFIFYFWSVKNIKSPTFFFFIFRKQNENIKKLNGKRRERKREREREGENHHTPFSQKRNNKTQGKKQQIDLCYIRQHARSTNTTHSTHKDTTRNART